MTSNIKRSRSRIFVFAVVLMVVALGNLRPQKSEAAGPNVPVIETLPIDVEGADREARPNPMIFDRFVAAADIDTDLPSSVEANPDEANREGPSVPGIYSWDPDARFLYFRQVSKW